ncbi:DMT family transporter [Reichenbachiella versicolor]|uniref:DMT family transporter n=1 Tax=Reichenbachiella versicolor TaxID=1821036 RepID=UPI000D6E0C1B|nr:DMT family transporter [Reichenbachiella versicolor]
MNKTIPLFVIPALIWGSTWYVIKFQLGTIDPLVSVSYRYWLAGLIMLIFCLLTRANMKFNLKEHLFMALQGLFLFGLNYWTAYEAEVHITSGMMAIAFSCIVFANSLFGKVFLKIPINRKIILGAMLALVGTILIFSAELVHVNFSPATIKGMLIAMLSMTIASLGQITSARNSKNGIPVLQANAFGMLYGAFLMSALAWLMGLDFSFDVSVSYVASLMYLAVFGSVVAFGAYLTLIAKIGADRASYSLVVIPVISMSISGVFEGYQWSIWVIIGVSLILVGNVLALRNKMS